jgi:hypothetical protein
VRQRYLVESSRRPSAQQARLSPGPLEYKIKVSFVYLLALASGIGQFDCSSADNFAPSWRTTTTLLMHRSKHVTNYGFCGADWRSHDCRGLVVSSVHHVCEKVTVCITPRDSFFSRAQRSFAHAAIMLKIEVPRDELTGMDAKQRAALP